MGEILISCFIGVWLALCGLMAYRQLKKEQKERENHEK